MSNRRVRTTLTRIGMLVLTVSLLSGCSSLGLRRHPARRPPVVTLRRLGRSWFFFHQGRPFVVRGVNCVLPQDFSTPEGSRGYDAIRRYKGQYGRWRFDTVCRLHCWGFNTVSAWSHPSLYGRTDLYYTVVVPLQGPDPRNRLIDVFSRRYRDTVMRIAQASIPPHATNRTLVGYYVNNELPWYGEKAWPGDPTDSLLVRYLRLGPGVPGKRRAVRFLRDFYAGSFAAFQRDFSTTATSFEELLPARDVQPHSPHFREADRAWCGIVAERYYSLCRQAIRRYDPYHLILGSRFSVRAPLPVIEACARYCDVVSLNYYVASGQPDAAYLDTLAARLRRPLIISEFSWRAIENSSQCPNHLGAAVTVRTQEDRARCYEKFVTALMRRPWVVGYEWFQYFDQPPAGRSFDGEDSNYGLVDIYDRPYVELLRTVSRVNRAAETWHRHPERPRPPDPALLEDIPLARVPPPPPSGFEPIAFTNPASWKVVTWGDTEHGADIRTSVSNGALRVEGYSGDGWGAGISLALLPRENPEVLRRLYGTHVVEMDITAERPVRVRFAVNETGHGVPDAPQFNGVNGADGEAYVSFPRELAPGRKIYRFNLNGLERNCAYGNQNGNRTLDTAGLAEIGFSFPPGQSVSLVISGIRFR